MSGPSFATLLSPLRIGDLTVRNRIVFTGHDSKLQEEDGTIGERYIAYQLARTRGGAGLQILAASRIDDTSGTTAAQLSLASDDMIAGYRAMVEAIASEGGTVFAQLLHAGREIYDSDDGTRPVTYSASAARSERFFVLPRELGLAEIADIIASYAQATRRAVEAGIHGIEIVASQGNLPAQFLTPSVNRRTDAYGGSLENRQRFLIETTRAVRAAAQGRPVGVRISVADLDHDGLEEDESIATCRELDRLGLVDFIHACLGTPSTRAGAYHIAAPMTSPAGYVTPYAERVKKAVRVPVIATGRYNTPQAATEALRKGAADALGMTRAMICDPQLGRKVEEARTDDIRACIACDQACIGHFQRGYPVSCIQFPESGRELVYGRRTMTDRPRRVLIAGGGPAGMKAAAVAAARGHAVTLCEAGNRLGGQALLAMKIPGRAEFGGIVTNLSREIEMVGVDVRLRTKVDGGLVAAERPDVLIVATGGLAARPHHAHFDAMDVVTANEILDDRAKPGSRVVIADSTCDWVGIGTALKLAANGHDVTLAVTGTVPGETIPTYVRDHSCGQLFDAGVKVVNYARLYGADAGTVYFEHITAMKPIELTGVDTLVLCFGAESDCSLERQVEGLDVEFHTIGDCHAPRTAEEAVLDGLEVATSI